MVLEMSGGRGIMRLEEIPGKGDEGMLINVMYMGKKFDMVKDFMLDRLIAAGKIRKFYRFSQAGWVEVGKDPIRGVGGEYGGPERRASH